MATEKAPSILFVLDDRASRDKIGVLTQTIHAMKAQFRVETIMGQDTNEAQLLEKIQKENFPLVIVPLHHYQTWNRIEGYFGLTRKSGPTFAGYFCEPVPLFKMPDPAGQSRRIILDFMTLSAQEIILLVGALYDETQRSGLKPLLKPNTPIYFESWYGNQGQGNRMDYVSHIPEIAQTDWSKRTSSIRILLSAFWSLVYEEGPGKSELVQANAGKSSPKAYFQVGADAHCFALRLYYYTLPHLAPKDAIQHFWPDRSHPSKAAQLLLQYADFVRVHSISETSDLEIVVGLFNSAPAEKSPDQLRTLWIEPLTARLVLEQPYDVASPTSPHLKPLPTVSLTGGNPGQTKKLPPTSDALEGRPGADQALKGATAQIIELRKKITEKDEKIQELRLGGIGTAQPPPPPDAEALIEAFQQKYFEARFQIRQFELQIETMQTSGANAEEIKELRLKMEALMNRERSWIKKLMVTLEEFRKSTKQVK